MGSALLTDVDDPPAPPPPRPARPVRLRDARELRWIAIPVAVDLGVLGVMWHALFRPLSHDEAWRAYHVTLTAGFFSSLKTANAPMGAGWLVIERACTALLGNVEWTLRLPAALSLFVFSVATYRLARWWLSPAWSSVTASLGTLNASLVLYGLQLKPYVPDAACTALVLCAWLTARERRDAGRSAWGPYLLVAACALVSLSALFLIGPLLVLDLVEALRRRDLIRWVLGGALLSGAVAGAHFVLFVRPQSFLTHNSYWQGSSLTGSTSHNLHHLLTAVVSFPASFATAAYTSPDRALFPHSALLRPPALPLHAAIFIGCAAVWIVGAFACTRLRGGPVLLVALGGAALLTTIAATRMEWPIGFVRPNLFVVPMLYVLGAIGLHHAFHSGDRYRQWTRFVPILGIAFCVAIAGTGLWRLAQLHRSTRDSLSLDNMRALVAEERRFALPGDLYVVVTRHTDVEQWLKPYLYYARLSDRTRLRFASPPSDLLSLGDPSPDRTREFLGRHRRPRHVFLVTYYADHALELQRELVALRESGFCSEHETEFGYHTGILVVLHPCRAGDPAALTAASPGDPVAQRDPAS